jgi:ribosomal subunit interface protein
MDISVNGKNLDIGEALRNHVEQDLFSAVTKYFALAHDGAVTISREAHLFRADITVHPVRGMMVQSHSAAEDPYAAFDSALERISKQIRRYKRRIKNHHARRGPTEPIPAQQYVIASEGGDEELPEESKPAIIAELPTQIDTLTVGDAVMRLDLADLPAMMFRNQASGGLNVVYRRSDGNIGWIDPACAEKP